MKRTMVVLPALLASLALPFASTSCGSDDNGSTGTKKKDAGADAPKDTGNQETGSDAAEDNATDTSTNEGGDAAAASLSAVSSFDFSKFELPEGLTIHGGDAYVSLAPLGKILKITPTGTVSTYATVPAGGNDGYTLGLAFDNQENLYVTQTKNNPDAGAITPGVFKIPPTVDAGMVSTPFATDPSFAFPNAIAFDATGNLLVTDSGSGLINKVTSAGAVSNWKTDVELNGSPQCPGVPLPFPIGANGIVYTPSAVYVANTAKGSIVKIDVDASGNAGTVSTIVKDCKYAGLDGLALDTDGTLLATQNGYPGQILRITTTGSVTVLASAPPLDGPASIAATADWNGEHVALITNSAFFSGSIDGATPNPALLRLGPLP